MHQQKTELTHKRTVINESQNILIYVYYLYTIRDIFSLLRNYDKIEVQSNVFYSKVNTVNLSYIINHF